MNRVLRISSFLMLILSISFVILDVILNLIEMPYLIWLLGMLVYWFLLGYDDYFEEGNKMWGGVTMGLSTGCFFTILFLMLT
ncbi:hypothetical protein SAMN04490247_0961 [Salimicrobium halophilum]|uniref:Uncharacterized protein n=1 Tax=Salimicrobium halophilum TaxID=86666 RepID=A0A1G8RD21_9BACI|nr:hypothetical protein SAMN04490247_0961 [Salimicrobium halophilum]